MTDILATYGLHGTYTQEQVDALQAADIALKSEWRTPSSEAPSEVPYTTDLIRNLQVFEPIDLTVILEALLRQPAVQVLKEPSANIDEVSSDMINAIASLPFSQPDMPDEAFEYIKELPIGVDSESSFALKLHTRVLTLKFQEFQLGELYVDGVSQGDIYQLPAYLGEYNIRHLYLLHVHYTELQTIPFDFTPFIELRDLSFAHNQLKQAILRGISSLFILNLSYNQLTEVDLSVIRTQAEGIDMSYNRIERLDYPTEELTDAKFNHNRLTSVNLKRAYNLNVSYNPLVSLAIEEYHNLDSSHTPLDASTQLGGVRN